MNKRPLQFIRVPTLLAGTALLCLGAPVHAQSGADQGNRRVSDNDTTPRGVAAFDRFMDSHPDIAVQVRQKPWLLTNYDYLQSHPDLNAFLQSRPQLNAEISQNANAFVQLENRLDQPDGKRDLTELDRFLDSHPDIATQLRQKPWLVTNYDFLQSHSDLKTFLQDHTQLNSEIGQNPVLFLQEENLYDRPEGKRDEAEYNKFMDGHPEIAEQVRKNPSLINDRDFERNHPPLQAFLKENPGVGDEIRRNPNAFTRQDHRFDGDDFARDRETGGPDRDDNRRAQFDKFLDSHREIAEQVRKNPSLADNREFLQNHPELQAYMQNNPDLRQDLRQHPDAFKQEENRSDRNANGPDRDVSHERMVNFGGFLGGHSDIAKDVSKNPTVVKDRDYVQHHAELATYLDAHPDVRDDLMANPSTFVKGAQAFSSASTPGSGTGTTGSGTTGSSTAAPGTTSKPR